MSKIKNYLHDREKMTVLTRALLLSCLPIIICLITVFSSGHSLKDVSLLTSEWNDELFYYKQVEGIVNGGYPAGFFGFNESHSVLLSFAAWSPLLVWPWVLWGFVFGWGLTSPFICNIVLLTIAVFVFAMMVKPSWKKSGVLTLLFMLFSSFARYMLSCMPEVICFSMLIVFYAFALSYRDDEKMGKLVFMFAWAAILTLMRPYMLLFLLLPWAYAIRRSRLKGAIAGFGVLVLTLGIYALIKKFLSAEYFAPLFFTDWITTFFTEGIGAGIRNFFATLYYKGSSLKAFMIESTRSGHATGAFFNTYLVFTFIFIFQAICSIRDYKKKKVNADSLILDIHSALSFTAMFFAILLMYKLTEGSKHLLTFIAFGIFLLAMEDTKLYKRVGLAGIVLAYFFNYKTSSAYDFAVTYKDEKVTAEYEYLKDEFDSISLTTNKPSFENTVVWTLADFADPETVTERWQFLYAAKRGMGINCIEEKYVCDNISTLKPEYISCAKGGNTEKFLSDEAWYSKLFESEHICVFKKNK